MDWITGMQEAIEYIEDHLPEKIDLSAIAKIAYTSKYQFQRAFGILCGLTVGEYIRYRRLSVAGGELIRSDRKIIDIALEYGYDTPESFTKAFTRYHGVTPSAARRSGAGLKSFERLSIQINRNGGEVIDYNIEKKDASQARTVPFLFGPESARAYPRTFIGSTAAAGLHHMVYETAANAVDEAIAGFCTNITVYIKADSIIEISDNGRGIPTAINSKTGISILETILCAIHDRDEECNVTMIFDGRPAVGMGVINALSEWFEAEIHNGREVKFIRFERGKKTSDLCVIGKTDRCGTTVRFKPDARIFDDPSFDPAEIVSMLNEQMQLHEGLTISLIDQRDA